VEESILENVATRLKGLDSGGYARVYRKNGKEYPSSLHSLIGELLDALGLEFKVGEPLFEGSSNIADFVVDGRLIFIGETTISSEEMRRIARSGRRPIILTEGSALSDIFDIGVRVQTSGATEGGRRRGREKEPGRLQTIFLDDPSFNFDYAHILPKTEKCSVMHGHTSSALVELVGAPIDGMVVDFNDAKPIIRDAIRSFDHKLFISDRYVVGEGEGGREDGDPRVHLRFETVHGEFEMKVPEATTVLMEGEATVENLAQELLGRIAPKMPENVSAVGVYVYEGLNKGTHLLAQIHRRESERQRKKKKKHQEQRHRQRKR
jgi:6-pyruvoyl-tetrahydropterin synthase